MRVWMYYHIFNDLDGLIKWGLVDKIGQGILSHDKMDRDFNYLNPSKVNGKCLYEGKFRKKSLTYKVKWSIREDIYIGNKQQTSRKIMDENFSDVQHILKTDKNQTHLLPTLSKTLNIPCHALAYVSLWCSK